jgi:hypothetical protein
MQTKKTFDSIANPPERGRLERPGAGFAPGRDLVGASRAQPGRRLAITKHWLVDPRTLFGGRPRPGFPACFGPPRGPRINALEGNPQKTGHKLQVVNYRMLTSSGSCSAELFFKPLIIGNSCREFFSVDNFCCPQTYPQKSRKLSTGRAGSCSAECSWDLAGFPPGVVQRSAAGISRDFRRELFSGKKRARARPARLRGRELFSGKMVGRELFSGAVSRSASRSCERAV